jgi:hypothetical protein
MAVLGCVIRSGMAGPADLLHALRHSAINWATFRTDWVDELHVKWLRTGQVRAFDLPNQPTPTFGTNLTWELICGDAALAQAVANTED